MQQIFEKARGTLSSFPAKASEFIRGLSAREVAQTSALGGATVFLVWATAAVATSGTLFGAMPFLMVATAATAGLFGRTASKTVFGAREITWKNGAGQTIKSTAAQQRELDAAQARIYRVLDLGASASAPGQNIGIWTAQKLAARFEQAASRVTVVADITPPVGKFTFAARGPALPLGTAYSSTQV